MNWLKHTVRHTEVLLPAPPKSLCTPIYFILGLRKKDFQPIEKTFQFLFEFFFCHLFI